MPNQSNAIDTMSTALTQQAVLGEGLLWNGQAQQWWWTDIESSRLYAWTPASGALDVFPTQDRVGSMALCVSGKILLGTAKALCLTDVTLTGQTKNGNKPVVARHLVAVDALESRTRVNDGRTDRNGNFVFGTMNEAREKRPIGSFYQYSMQHRLRRLALPAVAIANSICFSPNGSIMYFTDTLTRRIMQCNYDSQAAQVSDIRLFADVTVGYPDGSTVDSEGCLWNAQWGAAQVVRYAPDGRLMQRIAVPTKNPTCPAFGGVSMNQLAVTSSRQEMSAEELLAMPQAGSLFSFEMETVTGIPETLFNDQI